MTGAGQGHGKVRAVAGRALGALLRRPTAARYVRVVDPVTGAISMAEVWTPPGGAIWRVHRWAWRQRRRLVPVPLAAGLAADPFGGEQALLLLTLVTAWVLWVRRRTPLRSRAGATRAADPTVLVLWWLLPVPWWTVAPVAAALTGWRCWYYRRRPDPAPPVTRETEWADHVAAHGRAVPGSRLVDVRDVVNARGEVTGWTGTVELVKGLQETSQVRGGAGLIAGVYGVARPAVLVEQTEEETRPRVTVIHRKFLAEPIIWRGPSYDLDTGVIPMITLADGERGGWQAHTPGGGVRMGWIAGANGSGKTGAVNCLFGSLFSQGVACLDLTDLKGGISLPAWGSVAFRYGSTPYQARMALRRAKAVIKARTAAMALMPDVGPDGQVRGIGVSVLDPTPEWPAYWVVIEEWPELAGDPDAIADAEHVVRLGRAVCVGLILISQGANLDDTFGGSRVLRTQLQTGNVLVLWTDSLGGNSAIGSPPIDLSMIPRGKPGTGFLVSAAQPRGDILGRIDYVEHAWAVVDQARMAGPDPVTLAAILAMEEEEATYQAGLTVVPDLDSEPAAPRESTSPVRAALTGAVERAVITHLTSVDSATTAEVLAAVDGSDSGIHAALARLEQQGLVDHPKHGRWAVTTQGRSAAA